MALGCTVKVVVIALVFICHFPSKSHKEPHCAQLKLKLSPGCFSLSLRGETLGCVFQKKSVCSSRWKPLLLFHAANQAGASSTCLLPPTHTHCKTRQFCISKGLHQWSLFTPQLPFKSVTVYMIQMKYPLAGYKDFVQDCTHTRGGGAGVVSSYLTLQQ